MALRPGENKVWTAQEWRQFEKLAVKILKGNKTNPPYGLKRDNAEDAARILATLVIEKFGID